jgi:hypothetical protein
MVDLLSLCYEVIWNVSIKQNSNMFVPHFARHQNKTFQQDNARAHSQGNERLLAAE